MKKKLVIAVLALAVVFSSVISVAAVGALMREKSAFHLHRAQAYERARAEYALEQQAQEPAPVEEPARAPGAQPPAPRRGGRGVPPPTAAPGPESPTIPINAPRYQDQFPDGFDIEAWERSRDAVRLGQDLMVGPNDIVRDAFVVFGNATIAGRVTGDLHIFFGTARILSTAVIDGDFISVGGGATVQPGATVRRDVVVIGGPFDAPAGFSSGGEQIVVGSGLLGGSLNAVVPYLSRGLLWGRVIVPDLPWVWGVLALFFLLYAALNLIFDRQVRASAVTLQNRPLTAFGTGLLVLLLVGPICVLLAVSIIGLAVVPFVVCALIAGGIIGKVAVTRWIGMTAVEEDPDGNRAHAARSFVIGFAVLTIAYLIPLLGIITWAIVAVLGLGSSWLTFMAAYRRENPAKPPAMVPPPIAPPAPGTRPRPGRQRRAHRQPPSTDPRQRRQRRRRRLERRHSHRIRPLTPTPLRRIRLRAASDFSWLSRVRSSGIAWPHSLSISSSSSSARCSSTPSASWTKRHSFHCSSSTSSCSGRGNRPPSAASSASFDW